MPGLAWQDVRDVIAYAAHCTSLSLPHGSVLQGVFEESDHPAVVDRRLQDSACYTVLCPIVACELMAATLLLLQRCTSP